MAEREHADRGDYLTQAVLYPECYSLLVFASALDLLLTWVVLHLGGYEANVLAAFVIDRFDLPGVVAFKFGLMILVILISEYVGRRRESLGRALAMISVAFPATGASAGAMLIMRTTM